MSNPSPGPTEIIADRSGRRAVHARTFNEATNHPFARISDESTRSEAPSIIAHMFEQAPVEGPAPEVGAGFEGMAEVFAQRTRTEESVGWVARIRAGARMENQAAAAQLVAIGELFRYRLGQSSETEDWAVDTEAAVAAEVGAGLKISQGLAASKLRYARALRERLPKVGEVFCAGDIDFRSFATIVYRTDCLVDPARVARADGLVAANVGRWPSLTTRRLSVQVDKIVAQVDADAVRRA